MNLTNFHYPMFSTTDREKEILRMCELELIRIKYWSGICNLLFEFARGGRISSNEYTCLRYKIIQALQDKPHLDSGLDLPWPTYKLRALMRRIWITKLLAYKE